MAIPVILDTDIGSDIDDTWALAMLMRCPELDLKMVLTETADTTYRAALTAKFLTVAGRDDVPIAVGLPGKPGGEFQAPWLGEYTLDRYPGPVHADGVRAFIDLVEGSPEPVTVIAIAPPPSLSRALEIAPHIAENCRFAGMFGSIDRGYGTGSAPIAETNVRVDVSAAKRVLGAPWRNAVITPLDTCDDAILSGELYRSLLDSADPLIRAVFENYRVWAELVTWVTVDFLDERSSTLFDTVAVYLAYSRSLLQVERMRLSVTDEGGTVRDPNGHPLDVAMRWRDLEAFKAHLVERLLG